MHDNAYKDAETFAIMYGVPHYGMVAEIGSMDVNGSIRKLFDRNGNTYHGWDIEAGKGVDKVLSHTHKWHEIDDCTYDMVLSTQTLEHVRKPWLWLHEIARIAKPGALVYICAPNTHPYHEHPVDCWRVWPSGMMALMEDAGLNPVEVYQTGYTINGILYGDTTGIARKPG